MSASDTSTPSVYGQSKANFRLLVLDIAWFGLAIPATSQFLSIYAIRLDASPTLLGWLVALPAILALATSSLAPWWRRKYPGLIQALFWPAFGFRLAFLLPALTPFFPREWQPLWLVMAVALPAIPQGCASVLFLVMMRESIEDNQQLTALMSRRSMAFNVTVAIGTLAFGFWLERASFPFNYQAMFVAAYAFSLLSLLSAMRVRVLVDEPAPSPDRPPVRPWKSPAFRRVALMTIATHIALFSLAPIVPLRLVDELGGDEAFMSVFALAGTGAAAVMAGFTRRIVARFGSRATIAWGMVGTGAAGALIALSPTLYPTLVASALGGASWTLAAISLFSYFSESAPAEGLTRFTTAYNQIVMLSVFAGPMLGSQLASSVSLSLVAVLWVGAGLRVLSGVLVALEGVSLSPRRKPPVSMAKETQ
jgi:MFS family permease